MNGLRLFTMVVLIYHLLNKKASLFTHELITNVFLKLSVLHFGNLKSHFRLPFVFPFFLNMLLIASILSPLPPLSSFSKPRSQYKAFLVLQPPEEHDPQSKLHLEREWRFVRNSKVRQEAQKQQQRTGRMPSKLTLEYV